MPKIVQFKDGSYALRRQCGFLWTKFEYADCRMTEMRRNGKCDWYEKRDGGFNYCCTSPYLQTIEDFFEERKRRMREAKIARDDFGKPVKRPKEKDNDTTTKLADEPTAADLQTF